jgi:hypothetical protein
MLLEAYEIAVALGDFLDLHRLISRACDHMLQAPNPMLYPIPKCTTKINASD